MKIFFLTLIAMSSIGASAFATDLDDLSDQIDELNSKLDDANDKLDALVPDEPVYIAPPKRSPSYVLVPANSEPKSPPKPKDVPGGYWVESDNPKIGWHWIKGSPSKSGRFANQ
jgi:hypothetical protein